MKESSMVTTTYELEDDWMIDIIDYKGYREAWIYRSTIGVKQMMFGIPQEQTNYKEFLEIVESSIQEYKENYIEDLMIFETAINEYLERSI